MTTLKGSLKQVAWAEKIRAERIAALEKAMEAHTRQYEARSPEEKAFFQDSWEEERAHMGELRDWLSRQESASWWIDRRDSGLGALAGDFAYDAHFDDFDDYDDFTWPDWYSLLHE